MVRINVGGLLLGVGAMFGLTACPGPHGATQCSVNWTSADSANTFQINIPAEAFGPGERTIGANSLTAGFAMAGADDTAGPTVPAGSGVFTINSAGTADMSSIGLSLTESVPLLDGNGNTVGQVTSASFSGVVWAPVVSSGGCGGAEGAPVAGTGAATVVYQNNTYPLQAGEAECN